MENNVVETNKNKNLIVGVMVCVIILLIVALVYFLFIKKDKPEETVTPQNNTQEEIVKKAVYKTRDNKFSLEIVDNKSNSVIENEYKNELEKILDDEVIKGYAFLNNDLLALTYIRDDELYSSYHAYFPNNVTQFYMSFVVDKQNGIIIEKSESSEEALLRFSSENGWDSHVKTNAGYFMIFNGNLEPAVLYTIGGKKLGYISSDIQSDSQGVYVYDNINDDFDFDNSTPSKFDVNGNKIN